MTDVNEFKPLEGDPATTGEQIEAVYSVAKEVQKRALIRKMPVPYLLISGLLTLSIGLSAKRVEYTALGAGTELVGLATYGQARRQERLGGRVATAAAIYQDTLSREHGRGTPLWAVKALANVPHYAAISREEAIEHFDGLIPPTSAPPANSIQPNEEL